MDMPHRIVHDNLGVAKHLWTQHLRAPLTQCCPPSLQTNHTILKIVTVQYERGISDCWLTPLEIFLCPFCFLCPHTWASSDQLRPLHRRHTHSMENHGRCVVLCDFPDRFYNHASRGSFLISQTAEILHVKYHQWHQNTRGNWMPMLAYDNTAIIKSPSNIWLSSWSSIWVVHIEKLSGFK